RGAQPAVGIPTSIELVGADQVEQDGDPGGGEREANRRKITAHDDSNGCASDEERYTRRRSRAGATAGQRAERALTGARPRLEGSLSRTANTSQQEPPHQAAGVSWATNAKSLPCKCTN